MLGLLLSRTFRAAQRTNRGRLRTVLPATAEPSKWKRFQSNEQVAPEENQKMRKSFYSLWGNDLAQNSQRRPSDFSHQMSRFVQ